jgi:hypothetical protein
MKEVNRNLDYITYEEVNGEYKCVYTMVNMGDYIGFINRDFSEKGPDNYYLLFEDGYKNDKEIFHVESLVSEEGKYIKFIFETNRFERVIETDGEIVLSDTLFEKPNTDNMNKYSIGYYSNMITDNILISDYLKLNPVFLNLDDETFNTNVPVSRIIETFISKNKELKKVLKNN